jgi:rhodanese-related sulfurtransferase
MAIGEISVEQVDERRLAGALLFDVRENDEYHEAHAAGAVLVPLSELPSRVGDFPDDQPLLLICRSGGRSMRAAEFLAEHGRDVTNVAGGTMAWIAAGKPVVTGPDAE